MTKITVNEKPRSLKLTVVIGVSVVLLILLLIGINQYSDSKTKWDKCFDQLSSEIEKNNEKFKANYPGLEITCATHKDTIVRADACFKDVVRTNLISKFLLTNHQVKSLINLNNLQRQECSQYPQFLTE